MATPPPLPLLQLLYDAANSPYGTCVETDDPERLRQKLYPLRAQDPAFADLALLISPLNPTDLWIVKKAPTSEE